MWNMSVSPAIGHRNPRSGARMIRSALRAGIVAAMILAIAPKGQAAHITPFESPTAARPLNKIDHRVFDRLKREGISSSNLCSDSVFVRRIFLDVIGTLPDITTTTLFLEDSTSNKRSILIDQLLQRDEFADYWAMKWCDVLRVKAEFPIKLWPNAVQAYHRWIHTSIKENMPYDRFARELLTSSGSNFRVPQVNFYRALQKRTPSDIAAVVALTFMGCRTDKWPDSQRKGMEAFFSQVAYKGTAEWKEEIIHRDPGWQSSLSAVLPDGTEMNVPVDTDPRQAFAQWLTSTQNPWFTRSVVNRIWAWLLGRRIVHEPDDLRPDNKPVHPELLALLETELINSQYDLKHIYRIILNSHTYQQSSIPCSNHPKAESMFAHYIVRQLDAEVLIDAVCSLSDSHENYYSPIPEPFTFIPPQHTTINLADGSITSPFLEMFGRPPRDTGLMLERNNRPTAKQRLHMLNSSHIQKKLNNSKKLKIIINKFKGDNKALLDAVYLSILSRHPTETEYSHCQEYINKAGKGWWRQKTAISDLVWALINSKEFVFRH